MIRWLKQYFAVTRNAAAVAMSDPVYLILLLSVLTLVAFFAALPTFNFGQELRLIRDQNLALLFSGGCLMATLGTVTVIVRDLQRGAISVLMSRPISGFSVIAGKWSGLALALLVYHIPVTVACLWTSRISGAGTGHEATLDTRGLVIYFGAIVVALTAMGIRHYFFGGWYVGHASFAIVVVFTTAFLLMNFFGDSAFHEWGDGVDWRVLHGAVLILLAELVFAALLLPFAVKMEAATLMGVGVVIFCFGLISNFVVNSLLGPGIPYYTVKSILPNWQVFWISDWLATRGELNVSLIWAHIRTCLIHTGAYIGTCVAAAAVLFNRRELFGHDTH